MEGRKKGTYRSVVRVVGGHGGGGFSGQLSKLSGGDALVDAGTHFLRHQNRITVIGVQPVT